MSCGNKGTALDQIRAKQQQKLQKHNNFKNRFIGLWEKYGTFTYENGKKYFNDYKIDGNGEGAIAMSKLLAQPDLHSEVTNSKLDYVKLFLNFSKLITLSAEEEEQFKIYYVEQMREHEFAKLYYKIDKDSVLTSHFIKFLYDANNNKTGEEIIENDFLDELAWEIAERHRAGYKGIFPIDWLVDAYTPVEFIEYESDVSIADIEIKMSSLYDILFQDSGEGGEDYTTYYLPSLRDKILEYAVIEEFGTDVLDDIDYLTQVFGGNYLLDVEKARKMNGIAFLKVISESLDFKHRTKSKYFWRGALVAIVVFVVAVVLIYYGAVNEGIALLLSFGANVTQNKNLKILSYAFTVYTLGTTSFLELSYTEAFLLVLEVASLYVSIKTSIEMEDNADKAETSEEASETLYSLPYDIYNDMHCYDELISVSVDNLT